MKYQTKYFLLTVLLIPTLSYAECESLEIWPPNVGVFAKQKTQQFHAKCMPGGRDVTKKVDWYITEYPFKGQTKEGLTADKVAKIDKNGLLTVLSTWGRVRVNACLPRPCKPKKYSRYNIYQYVLLLGLDGEQAMKLHEVAMPKPIVLEPVVEKPIIHKPEPVEKPEPVVKEPVVKEKKSWLDMLIELLKEWV